MWASITYVVEGLGRFLFVGYRQFSVLSNSAKMTALILGAAPLVPETTMAATLTWIGVLGIAKYVVASRYRGSYVGIHSVVNTWLAVATYSDMLSVLAEPSCCTDRTSKSPLVLIIALHCFHTVYYWPLSAEDISHHISMIMVCAPYSLYHGVNRLTNYLIFFVSGLPGALSYALIFFCKNGMVSKSLSIRCHAAINVLLRGPFLVIGAYLGILAYLTSPQATWPWLIIALLIALNGTYYSARSVELMVRHSASRNKHLE